MNNRAFTLVELIAIIVVLAAIFLVSFPSLLNMTKVDEEKKYDDMVEDLCLAGESYIYANTDDFEELSTIDNKIEISVKTLIDYGNVDSNLKRPDTQESVINDYLTYTVLGDNSLYCEYKWIKVTLPSGLTPIIYNGTNWEVADTTKNWYNYLNQEWANAAILNDNVSTTPGTQLTDLNNQVKAMFVYIPRYEYKIEGDYGKGGTSSALPGEIEVNFIYKSQEEPTSGYTIHPAFTFGEKQLDGIWVGKFELSHTDVNIGLGCNATSCSTADGLRILPNVNSIYNNSISSLFYGIRAMEKEFEISGDTHMIKNSEWGAVAYLSQSKYGKYGNNDYYGTYTIEVTDATYYLSYKEIYMNKSSKSAGYITGSSNGTPSQSDYSDEQCPYDDIENRGNGKGSCGGGASTTGNITGIYDMSGGADEYVMGYYNFGSETWGSTSQSNYAGFQEAPDEKYYNEYTTSSNCTGSTSDACKEEMCEGDKCKGHALNETKSWYYDHYMTQIIKGSTDSDYSINGPWILRGGEASYSTWEGIFYSLGSIGEGNSTRVVLVSD